jgi:hypothetical protein
VGNHQRHSFDAWEKTKDAAEDVKAEVRKATN